MKSPILKQLQARVLELEGSSTVATLAATDLALGRVRWIRKGNVSVGLSRLNAACGGVVIIKNGTENNVEFSYLETWLNFWRVYIPAPGPTDSDERIQMRNFALEIGYTIAREQAGLAA